MIYEDDRWQIERMVVGGYQVNCYIVTWRATKEAAIFDPGAEGQRIVEQVRGMDVKVTAVINTHGHGDHIGGNAEVMNEFDVPLYIGRHETEMLADPAKNLSAPIGMAVVSPEAQHLLDEGDIVKIGGGELKVFHTPGHSPGSVVYVADRFTIVGDVLFSGSIGRTDFPKGSMPQLLQNIREKLFVLPEDVLVLSGHGPETTIGEEKATNPFLKPGFDPSMWG